MRRIIIALCLVFAASPAMAANRYMDNRIAATGTAQNSGSSTTTLKVASFSLFDTGVATNHADLANMGISITAGTSAPAVTTSFKITAVDTTDAAKPVLTVHTSFGATPADDWTFIIHYGCDANTTFNTQTKAGTLTGPKLSIYNCYSNSSSGDTIYVRGGGTAPYGGYDSTTIQYCLINGNGKNIAWEGFYATPGDLYLAASVRATSANSTNFPYFRSSANAEIDVGSGVSSATSITFRNIKFANTASGGGVVRNLGAGCSLAFNECILSTTDMAANGYGIADGTTSGVTKTLSVTESTMFTENTWLSAGCLGSLTIDNCDLTATIATTGNHPIILTGTEGDATNHILKATFNNITMTYDSATDASTASMIVVTGMSHCNPITLTNITATYDANGCFFVVSDGVSNCKIESCTVTCTATPTAQTMIAFGLDTQPSNFACGTYATVLHSAAASAAGTGTATAGGSTFILSSTGSPSSVDDFYIDRFIRFPGSATQRMRRIDDYVGATRTITIWGTWDATTAAPAYQIVKYNRVSSLIVVRNNTLRFTGDRSHVILFGQGCDGAIAENNTCLNGDYSIVVKAEDCKIIGNKVTGETPMILKGASRNLVEHNTFYSIAAGPSTAVFEFSDKSPTVENLHNNFGGFAKCSGNIIRNNIIAVKSSIGNRCMFEYDIGDGAWAEDADDGPLRQNNLIDYNVYVMGNGSNFAYVDSANVASFTAWKAKMANVESDGVPYSKMFPLNDANSYSGTITFKSDTDLTVTGGTMAAKQGSDGQLIGAGRSRSYLISR